MLRQDEGVCVCICVGGGSTWCAKVTVLLLLLNCCYKSLSYTTETLQTSCCPVMEKEANFLIYHFTFTETILLF